MTYYAFSALFNFLTSSILGGFVLFKNGRNRTHRAFVTFAATVALWSLAYYFWQVAADAPSALFWCRALMAGAIFIPVTYLHFVLRLLNIPNRKGFLIASYSLFGGFLLLDLTPLFVSHVEPLLNFPFWPIAGPSFAFFLPLWYLYVVYSTYLLFKKYQTSAGIRRLQLKYVFLGMVFAFAGGSTNYFLWYRVPIPPIFNILVSAFVAAIAYAILRYRLMDIRVVARRAVVVVGAGLVIYAAFRGAVWAELTSVGGLDSAKAVLGGVALALLFVPFFQWMIQMIERTANRTFFLALYNYQEAISKVSGQLTFHTDLAEITRLIVETIRKAMGVNTVSVQLAEDEAKIDAKDSLMAYLERTQRPVVREELDLLLGDDRLTGEEARFQAVHERMKIIGAAACLPLISNGRLIGMVALSPKAIGDPFTQEDMELLTVLANQASIAIDNARLVRKVKDFNKTLRQKVRKQTEGLRRQAEHLEKLLKMRSEFLDIASHQLKTPVSVIYGTVSMLQEGTIQKLPPEQQASFYQGIMVKAKKLTEIIRDILNASDFDTKAPRLSMDLAREVDLDGLLARLCSGFRQQATERKLTLSYTKAKDSIAHVLGSEEFLEQALSNLIDNAIKYTNQGTVSVVLGEDDKDVIVTVKDTGVGIPKDDQSRMFGKFERAKNARSMYTDGTGLGLYISKEMIEAHPGGQIGFISEEGKGTQFTVTLPALKQNHE